MSTSNYKQDYKQTTTFQSHKENHTNISNKNENFQNRLSYRVSKIIIIEVYRKTNYRNKWQILLLLLPKYNSIVIRELKQQ